MPIGAGRSGLLFAPDKLACVAHPLEQTIREAYAAFGRGDVDGYLRPCTDNFTLHVPGRGGISGAYVGRGGLYELAGKAMQITGGTFQEDVEDVLANDHHARLVKKFMRHSRNTSVAHQAALDNALGSGAGA